MRVSLPLLLIGAACAACSDTAAPKRPLVVVPEDFRLEAGDTARIIAQNARAGVTWRSGAPAIATVNASGLVTGVSTGVALIWAHSGRDSAAASVSVIRRFACLTSTISPATVTLAVGDTARAQASARCPSVSAATNWTSSDTTIATVVSRGAVDVYGVALITARNVGDAVVTAWSSDDPTIRVSMAVMVR